MKPETLTQPFRSYLGNTKVPKRTITRLSRYLRVLEKLEKDGLEIIVSEKLAHHCNINSSIVRKDLTYFGVFGTAGKGYSLKELLFQIKKILGLHKGWRLGVIGMGNLGSALISSSKFPRQGYHFTAAFDKDPKKIGRVTPLGFRISSISDFNQIAFDKKIDIAVITTPPNRAQDAANLIINTPIRGILNFSPVALNVPNRVIVQDIDFTLKLDSLVYQIKIANSLAIHW